jgi:hypothetical protein
MPDLLLYRGRFLKKVNMVFLVDHRPWGHLLPPSSAKVKAGVHKQAASNNQTNDDHTIFPNKFFDTILKIQIPQTQPHKTP